MLRKLASLVHGIVGVIILLLSIRFILEILRIGPGSEFTNIIYTASSRLRDPLIDYFIWLGVIESSNVLMTFLTIVIYATIGWFIAGSLGAFAQPKKSQS
ncbi:MAG: hypothetical protein WDZ75_01685 [Candidatus Paceibacterota bacterium]